MRAKIFNDPPFKPYYNAHLDLRYDFVEPVRLLDTDGCKLLLVIPNKIKEILATLRCKESFA